MLQYTHAHIFPIIISSYFYSSCVDVCTFLFALKEQELEPISPRDEENVPDCMFYNCMF